MKCGVRAMASPGRWSRARRPGRDGTYSAPWSTVARCGFSPAVTSRSPTTTCGPPLTAHTGRRSQMGRRGGPGAPRAPRRFHSSVVYDDKLWVIAGYHHGNRNDVWHSSDGSIWHDAHSEAHWAVRHAPACLTFDGRLWLMGGYGDTLYHDVWTYSV